MNERQASINSITSEYARTTIRFKTAAPASANQGTSYWNGYIHANGNAIVSRPLLEERLEPGRDRQ
jgi:hypothetical protein